jgi:rhodanese-related sulfurtransferase
MISAFVVALDEAAAIDAKAARDKIILYFRHGERSLGAVQFLKQQRFQNVHSLAGGHEPWKNA